MFARSNCPCGRRGANAATEHRDRGGYSARTAQHPALAISVCVSACFGASVHSLSPKTTRPCCLSSGAAGRGIKKTKRVSRKRLHKWDSYLVQNKSEVMYCRALLQRHLREKAAESGVGSQVTVDGIQFEKNAVVPLLARRVDVYLQRCCHPNSEFRNRGSGWSVLMTSQSVVQIVAALLCLALVAIVIMRRKRKKKTEEEPF